MSVTKPSSHFIKNYIEEDLKNKRFDHVKTRFPPEPNGYLHIGHAKSICLNFGIAQEYNATCNLRFDDTNPEKEEEIYIESIKEDVNWLGFDWENNLYFASDYFDKIYESAVKLINKGRAYVCDLTNKKMREYRGSLTEPGKDSPNRELTVDENLKLFEDMKLGKYSEGKYVLRAKINMSSPNLNLRDPILYRIKKVNHHRTGDKWNIYPMYDFTHPLSDAFEDISHSLCTLEFEDHRPLYKWVNKESETIARPRQIEFARLNLNYMVLSKRKLLQLVNNNIVEGWDDPRMPTLSGLRKRGYTPSSIRTFCDKIGMAKRDSQVDFALLEFCLRDELNKTSPRAMVVLKPLKVTIENYPSDSIEELEAINNPENESAGTRRLPFGKTIYIEQEDFMEQPHEKYFRLSPGSEVRLKFAYVIECINVIKDESGKIQELICKYDPETKGGKTPDGRKIKSTIHWVSASHALSGTVKLYNHLFEKENPEDTKDDKTFLDHINPNSLEIVDNCKFEPSLVDTPANSRLQFERIGYFKRELQESNSSSLDFIRIVTLKDAWANIKKRQKQGL